MLFQQYYYYINSGIHISMLAPMPPNQMQHVRKMVSRHLLSDPRFTQTTKSLDDEIEADYYFSLRKGIGKCQTPSKTETDKRTNGQSDGQTPRIKFGAL